MKAMAEVRGGAKRKQVKSAHRIKFDLVTKSKLGSFSSFPHYAAGVVRSDPGRLFLSEEFGRNAHEFFYFQPRADDVWILSFPKCGSIWMQELVWMLVNKCNAEAARKNPLFIRCPFLEASRMASLHSAPSEVHVMVPKVSVIEKMPSPRVIKTHLPFDLLHPQLLETSKVIYIVRNPKDVCISYFYHHKLFNRDSFIGSADLFAQYFMNDEVYFSPFFPHVLEAWSKRNHPNLLFVFHENIKRNMREEVIRMANFLNKSLTERQLTDLCHNMNYENFIKNQSMNSETARDMGMIEYNNHIRLGDNGGWQRDFSPVIINAIDQWIEDNLRGTDFRFCKASEPSF